jgi:hypothetical protein
VGRVSCILVTGQPDCLAFNHETRSTMNTILFIRSSTLTQIAWRSFVSYLTFPFRHFVSGRAPRVLTVGRGSVRNRLHASFILAMAVLLACVMAPPAVAGLPF